MSEIKIDLTTEEMDEVIRALHRAEMQRPVRYCRKDGAVWTHCPTCGNNLQSGQGFCVSCGQKIDWSKEE